MKKDLLKQKATALHYDGLSYGAIAKQLETPKSTVYRWINNNNEEINLNETVNGTNDIAFDSSGTDSGTINTAFGTGDMDNGTNILNLEHNSNKNDPAFDEKSKTNTDLDEVPSRNQNEITQLSLRKIDLDHKFRMAELDFRKHQYIDTQKASHQQKELQKLQTILEKKTQKHSMQPYFNTTKDKDAIVDKSIPKDIYQKFSLIVNKYFSFDNKPCREKRIRKLYYNSQQIRLDIYSWASKNKIRFSEIKELSYFNELITDIGETWENIDENLDEEIYLEFDHELKNKITMWINKRLA